MILDGKRFIESLALRLSRRKRSFATRSNIAAAIFDDTDIIVGDKFVLTKSTRGFPRLYFPLHFPPPANQRFSSRKFVPADAVSYPKY